MCRPRRSQLLGLALAAGLLAAPPAAATAAVSHEQAVQLGRQAYDYGFPLLEFVRVAREQTSVRADDGLGDAPVNEIANAKALADPRERTIVAPNVDTLYSTAHLDLGKGPIVLSHPEMGKRYFDFEFLDPYTNVVGYVGTRVTGTRPRRTAIVWSGHRAWVPKGVHVLRVPYRRIWMIGRTLVRGPSDLAAAKRAMAQYTLTSLGRPQRRTSSRPGRPRKFPTATGVAFFDALAAAMKDNPPPARDRALLAQLEQVGIAPGRGPTAAGVSADIKSALAEAYDQASAALQARSRTDALSGALASGGWYTPPSAIGDYGTDYDLRAVIALAGLGANTPAEAIYPIALADSDGRLFNGANRYTLTFAPARLPPTRAFWSLTMYSLDGYLTPNAANLYAVGDTHLPLVKRADGSVVVAIQKDRPSDPTVNWLPPPDGPFRLNLRLYWPKPAALTAAWKPPPVIRAPASA